jgi:hypothetical protein
MASRNRQNNRQKVTGPSDEYYLHPRKGYKRKRPLERARNLVTEMRLAHFKRGMK